MSNIKGLLKQYFGYDEFRPYQEDVINTVLNKQDVFVLMPTGGGKSLCYQLPAIAQNGLTVVVSPLIALMKDQVDALVQNGVQAAYINSTLSSDEVHEIKRDIQSGEIKLLYIAPERFAVASFQDFLRKQYVDLVAVDEAHCISEWGHDFRPDYRNLRDLRTVFPGVPIIALTATATERVRNDIISQLSLHSPNVFISSFDRPNLNFTVLPKRGAYQTLVTLLNKHKGESAIIYCFSRKDTENIAMDLADAGFKVLPYHAGLSAEERKRNQEQFITDKVDIIVATIAFGMGIDKPDVRLVVHHSFPKSLEGYYQEIGRAGRDGLPSECVLLYSYADKMKHEFFFNEISDQGELERAQKKIQEMVDYCELRTCRRSHLLRYFGESQVDDMCGNCDVCTTEQEMFDATVITQKILSAIIRTESRFGKIYIIDVLKGKQTDKIVGNGHEQLSVFGIVNDYTRDELRDIMGTLIALGYIAVSSGEYPTVGLSQKGAEWLRSNTALSLPRAKKASSSVVPDASEAISYDKKLYTVLKQLRMSSARERNVPPFVIFSDVSLQEMARFMPQDKTTFLRINGVGEKKLYEFGDLFMNEIKKYVAENNVEPEDISHHAKAPRQRVRKSQVRNKKYEKTKQMIVDKTSLAHMAEAHGVKEGTIISHIEKLLSSGEDLDITHLLPEQDIVSIIENAFETCNTTMLKPIYTHLEEIYDYDTIKLVRLFWHDWTSDE